MLTLEASTKYALKAIKTTNPGFPFFELDNLVLFNCDSFLYKKCNGRIRTFMHIDPYTNLTEPSDECRPHINMWISCATIEKNICVWIYTQTFADKALL